MMASSSALSGTEQLRHNLTAVTEGPLLTDVLTAIDDAALKAQEMATLFLRRLGFGPADFRRTARINIPLGEGKRLLKKWSRSPRKGLGCRCLEALLDFTIF